MNKDELWEILKEEWENLDIEFIHKLYCSMPDYVESLYKAYGKYTHY